MDQNNDAKFCLFRESKERGREILDKKRGKWVRMGRAYTEKQYRQGNNKAYERRKRKRSAAHMESPTCSKKGFFDLRERLDGKSQPKEPDHPDNGVRKPDAEEVAEKHDLHISVDLEALSLGEESDVESRFNFRLEAESNRPAQAEQRRPKERTHKSPPPKRIRSVVVDKRPLRTEPRRRTGNWKAERERLVREFNERLERLRIDNSGQRSAVSRLRMKELEHKREKESWLQEKQELRDEIRKMDRQGAKQG